MATKELKSHDRDSRGRIDGRIDGQIPEWVPSEEGLQFARKALGSRLVMKRVKAELTQTQVAEYLGLSQPTYARFEKGTAVMSQDDVAKLAALYSCRVSDLAPNECYPSAPSDPEERLKWARGRSHSISHPPQTEG